MEQNYMTLQLLDKLEKNSRKQTRYARIQCVFSIAAALFCLILLINVLALVPKMNALAESTQEVSQQVQQIADQAQTVMDNLENVSNQLVEADLAGMVEQVDTLVTTSQEALTSTMDKIDKLDLEKLNDAIQDLSDVIKPLANFFNSFG